MSTATTASIGNRSDINAAHAEPYVSGMMRRINGMIERGIAAIERRTAMEAEARRALRETQQMAQVVNVSKASKRANDRDNHMRHTILEINSGAITCGYAYRKFGYRKKEMLDFARSHAMKVNLELFVMAGMGVRQAIVSMIQDDRNNADIMSETGATLDYVQKVRREITGRSEQMRSRTKSHAILEQARAGLSPEQIAAKLEINRQYIVQIMRENGFKVESQKTKQREVAALLANGLSIDAVAQQVKCSRNYVYRVRHDMGIKSTRVAPKLIVEMARKAHEYRRQGLNNAQIAIAMNRSRERVRNYLSYRLPDVKDAK